MLDLKFIRENADLVKEGARKKRVDVDIDQLIELDAKRRQLITQVDELRAEQNTKSKAIGSLPPEERSQAAAAVKELKERIKSLEAEEQEMVSRVRDLSLLVPSPPADDVPDGDDDQDNVEMRRHGEVRSFDFDVRDHLDLALMHDGIEVERATRIAGSRTYFLKGACMMLERAVLQLALDHMVAKGFTPLQIPLLVRRDAMEGTAYFPGGEEQAYTLEKDELHLVGTAEVPMTAFHMGEILDHQDLPRKFVASSPCFRREAGTYGRDTKGFYRVHQFMKVEQVIIGPNDEALSKQLHQEILGNSEEVVQLLELPYRVVNVCGGDLGLGQVQKFDIECWMPSRENWGETHSASRFHDFQARRLSTRYRDANGKVQICHTLNNTVIASPRILIPLLENHQLEDGSIRIPEALQRYMGGIEVLRPEGP